MKNLAHVLLTACALSPLIARGTTVIPPTFDELVTKAELIFRGSVMSVHSQWVGEAAERHIATYVTFKVEDALKGEPGTSYTLQILGGTVGSETMGVSDSPKFVVGDQDLLFVEHNGQQFVPLVGIMNGRFHITRDAQTGRDMLATSRCDKVTDLDEIGKETGARNTAGPAISVADFKAAIQSRLRTKNIP